MMVLVVVALTPCIFMAMYNTGYQANCALGSCAEVGAGCAADGGAQADGWRSAVMNAVGIGCTTLCPFSCLLLGALNFLPILVVAFVVGGGIAGLQTALDLGDQGYKVAVVEKDASIGGKMIRLSKYCAGLETGLLAGGNFTGTCNKEISGGSSFQDSAVF
jgi:hypothetical protein